MPEIVFNPLKPQNLPQDLSQGSREADLRSQIENLQTTLASLNQRVIILQETLQEKDQEIVDLKAMQAEHNKITLSKNTLSCKDASPSQSQPQVQPKTSGNVTIVGVLIDILRFIFWPKKKTANRISRLNRFTS